MVTEPILAQSRRQRSVPCCMQAQDTEFILSRLLQDEPLGEKAKHKAQEAKEAISEAAQRVKGRSSYMVGAWYLLHVLPGARCDNPAGWLASTPL
jgi:hypothetical protein